MPVKYLIAIVDDDPDVPAALSSLIRSLGHRVECFGSAASLFERGQITDFSCVISDFHMPVMTGLDVLRRVRQDAPGVPVIIMTGRPEAGLEDRALHQGAIALMTKPFSTDSLIDGLAKAFTRR